MTTTSPPRWPSRLPFYYGWVVIAIAFVTMAVAVSTRTAFSLLLAPLVEEFGWPRGLAAGAFSFGFLVSAVVSPLVGRIIDRRGPRLVVETGVVLMTAGLLLAPYMREPWHLYLTLGVLVGSGSNLMSFTAQSLYLPNWFVRRRGLALSLAFAGVGAGAILLLPWQQAIIAGEGWRAACRSLALLAVLVLGPINLLVWRRPQEVGLEPDGVKGGAAGAAARRTLMVVDAEWVATEWTLARALRTARFWWIALGYACALFAWYAVQVHQTKFLMDVGFPALDAAWALGFVSVVAIPGQVALGWASDRIGREWIWTAAAAGFAICYAALIGLAGGKSYTLLWVMVVSQGFLGYALTSVMGPIVSEIFEGPHYGTIFGTLTIALIAGGALGPWVAGIIHDRTGSYVPAFEAAIVCCAVSAASIWLAAPRKVRLVPGRAPKS